ncbi:hypothetical protein D3C83_214830 [compost metagenome]
MARLRATISGASPLDSPRFMLACSPVLTPPARVVTNARTFGAAGQSGTSHCG